MCVWRISKFVYTDAQMRGNFIGLFVECHICGWVSTSLSCLTIFVTAVRIIYIPAFKQHTEHSDSQLRMVCFNPVKDEDAFSNSCWVFRNTKLYGYVI